MPRGLPANTSAGAIGDASGRATSATATAVQAALCCSSRRRRSTTRTLAALFHIKIGFPNLNWQIIEVNAEKMSLDVALTIRLVSSPALQKKSPSGENDTLFTDPLCPRSV
jgi:hypothetical protein